MHSPGLLNQGCCCQMWLNIASDNKNKSVKDWEMFATRGILVTLTFNKYACEI